MVRTCITVGLAAALLVVGGCSKDPEDPGFTSDDSAGATDAATDSNTSGQATTDEGTSGDDSTTSTSTSTSTTSGGTGDMTTGPTMCGDGMVGMGEQCDGADLQGFECSTLGLGSGTLSCDPMTCTFDTSMCMSTSSGTSG